MSINSVDSTQNYYKLLDVSSTATDQEINKAYKKAALKSHPDKATENGLTVEKANDAFSAIREAYETLLDPEKRKKYDRLVAPKVTSTPQPASNPPPKSNPYNYTSKATAPPAASDVFTTISKKQYDAIKSLFVKKTTQDSASVNFKTKTNLFDKIFKKDIRFYKDFL